MDIKIYGTFTLSQVQTVSAIILNVLGIGWLFFLSNIVIAKALYRINNDHIGVPILEAIVPTTVTDILKILRIKRLERMKRITSVVITSLLVIIGLILTSFEGIIVVNSIKYVETCKTITVISKARISNENHTSALWSEAEVEAMMNKRSKSGVPDGKLVGQIPIDDRWKFDSHLDVDPYAWKSSCSLYKSGVTQVNMNSSIMYGSVDLRELLPEVHAEYTFNNGYNYTSGQYAFKTYIYYNKTEGTDTYFANGALILLLEEFKQGDFLEIGAKYMNRMWTLRVPETTRFPYYPENDGIIEILSVPIVVKAYTCEMGRVKEGNHGSYNVFNQNIKSALETTGNIAGRKWSLAVINGNDTSVYELTPEHWASYLAVKDTQTPEVEEVLVQINIPCILIHPVYTLLICVYLTMFIIGCICKLIIYKSKPKMPSGVIEWASLISYNANNDDLCDYNFGVISDENYKNDIEIFFKRQKTLF